MKSLHRFVFLLLLLISFSGSAVYGQTAMKQRVERYLFSSYDMTKSGLKEKERLIKMLDEKLDDYILTLDKESLKRLEANEKEFDQFLIRLGSVNDIKAMYQMVEESKRSHKVLIASVLEKGCRNLEEVKECRKALAFIMMEQELLKLKNEKLVILLKDDFSRSKFVDSLLTSGKISDETDIKSLMNTVDITLSEYEI